jgi:hypothetical protein
MMKKVIPFVAVTTALMSTSVLALNDSNSVQYVAADHSMASALCVTVATGNKAQVRNAIANIKPTHMTLRNYEFAVNHISCNGEELVDFALTAGNDKVAEHLSKHRFGNIDIRDIAMRYQGKVKVQE